MQHLKAFSFILTFFIFGCGNSNTEPTQTNAQSNIESKSTNNAQSNVKQGNTNAQQGNTQTNQGNTQTKEAKPVKQDKQSNTQVTLETSLGDIVLVLNADKAPKSVANFVQYVNDGHYDGTIFHRVKDFMVQGGGFDADMNKKTTRDPIQNEANNGLKNDRGAIAMARTNDPNSATAQFFINVTDNDYLNKSSLKAGYAVFGKVVSGMDVVDKIRATETSTFGQYADVPVTPIVIKSAKVIK